MLLKKNVSPATNARAAGVLGELRAVQSENGQHRTPGRGSRPWYGVVARLHHKRDRRSGSMPYALLRERARARLCCSSSSYPCCQRLRSASGRHRSVTASRDHGLTPPQLRGTLVRRALEKHNNVTHISSSCSLTSLRCGTECCNVLPCRTPCSTSDNKCRERNRGKTQ